MAARQKLGLEGKTVLSSVARLQHYKGHDLILQAMARPPRRRT